MWQDMFRHKKLLEGGIGICNAARNRDGGGTTARANESVFSSAGSPAVAELI